MLVTITQFAEVERTPNGEVIQMGRRYLAADQLTANGTSPAFATGCKLIRVATDTSIEINPYGEGTGDEMLLPAGAVEFFPAAAAQTLTIAEVV